MLVKIKHCLTTILQKRPWSSGEDSDTEKYTLELTKVQGSADGPSAARPARVAKAKASMQLREESEDESDGEWKDSDTDPDDE